MSKKWIAVGFAMLALLAVGGCGKVANPAGALFNNANWRALDKAPDQHKGASVDVVGQVDLQASRDSEGILNWGIRIGLADGHSVYAFCNTTSSLDESLLASKNWIRVRGTVMGGAPTSDWTHILIYAETVEQAQPQWARPTANLVRTLQLTFWQKPASTEPARSGRMLTVGLPEGS